MSRKENINDEAAVSALTKENIFFNEQLIFSSQSLIKFKSKISNDCQKICPFPQLLLNSNTESNYTSYMDTTEYRWLLEELGDTLQVWFSQGKILKLIDPLGS